MSVSHETCLLDQVFELIINEKPPNSNSLFLDEDSEKRHHPEKDLHWLHRAMQKQVSETTVRMCSINRNAIKAFLHRNSFVIFTMVAVVVGIILGFAVRPQNLSEREIKYLSFPGELLMRMLQMMVLPLIISSLVTGVSYLDSKATGKMGMRAIVYYVVTTLIAVFIGIVIVTVIRPGKGQRDAPMSDSSRADSVTAADAFLDLIRNMFPSNLVEACFKQYRTLYKKTILTRNITVMVNASDNVINATELSQMGSYSTVLRTETIEEISPVSGSSNGVNALGLVVFSMFFGFVIGNMKQQGQPLKDFFDCLNDAIMRLVAIIMWYAPVGILFLIAGKIAEMKDMLQVGGQLGMYMLCVIVGLLIHSIVVLPLLFFFGYTEEPLRLHLWSAPGFNYRLRNILKLEPTGKDDLPDVLSDRLLSRGVIRFIFFCSSATLPITLRCLEENNNVDKRVTRLVLPVGATINMDGTALYEAVAAIFIAQVNDMDLNLGQILTISITATAASIGAAAIPQAGLVTMVIVLTSVGLPTEDITLIVAVDWFLDRLRTTTNVLGDSLGAGIVEHLSREELQNLDAGISSSVIEVNEKPYQLISQEDDCLRHPNSETPM